MNPKWAEENLQTIRTLMERSAIYRRALAPVMMICGITGLAGSVAGWQWQIDSGFGFVTVWITTAVFALVCSTLLVRQQALKADEPFWSPPTKRIAQALLPPFVVGGFIGGIVAFGNGSNTFNLMLIPVWCLTFGCAICSAGFFMPRGIKIFGWIFIFVGVYLIMSAYCDFSFDEIIFTSPHLLMGSIFGGLHLAYGIYLYFTEKKTPVA